MSTLAEIVWLLCFRSGDCAFGQPQQIWIGERLSAFGQVGPIVHVEAFCLAIVQRQHVVLGRFGEEQFHEFRELFGILLRRLVA